jgi:hypothetical protein
VPVLIYVYPDGKTEGWCINFTGDGTPVKGTYITQSEIEANDYWLGHIRTRTAWFSAGNSTGQGATGVAGLISQSFGFGPSEGGGIPNLAYSDSSLSIVPIDWPTEYNYDVASLATSVTNPTSNLINPIVQEASEFFMEDSDDLFEQRAREIEAAQAGQELSGYLRNIAGNLGGK